MKRILSFVLSLVIFVGALAVLPVSSSAAEDTQKAVRRVVSVVYDDSGSMFAEEGDRWAYANYAMQSFVGMLGSDDKLFITYMSDYENYYEIKLDENNVQNEIYSIRDHKSTGTTPYDAVITAHKALTEIDTVKDEWCGKPETQYWLVIMSDGGFDGYDVFNDSERLEDLDKKLREFTIEADERQPMPNGSYPNIIFFGMGDDVTNPTVKPEINISVKDPKNAEDIRKAMADISTEVSGKTKVSAIEQGSSSSIKVTTKVPSRNITVFIKNSDANFKSIKSKNNPDGFSGKQTGQLNFSKIPLEVLEKEHPQKHKKYSELYPELVDKNFSGLSESKLLIESKSADGIIKEDTYEIVFDGKVDAKDVEVFYEPAVELVVSVEHDGKKTEINNVTHFKQYFDTAIRKSEYKISCKLCEVGNRANVYDLKDLDNAKINISVVEVEKKDDKVDYIGEEITNGGKSELSFELTDKMTEIRVSADLGGYTPPEYYALFTPNPKIELSAVNSGSVSVKYKDITKNKDMKLSFIVTEDGEQITDGDRLKELFKKFEVSVDGCEGETNFDDGMISFTPNKAKRPDGINDKFDVKVTCVLKNGKFDGELRASKDFTITIANYVIIATDAKNKVKKTEFYGNDVGVSFYIQMFADANDKTGVKLSKKDLEEYGGIDKFIELTPEGHASLNKNGKVASDGTITVVPTSSVEHKLTFWNWWINWAYYFGLEGDDVTVHLYHPLGDGVATINVVGEDIGYMLLNVYTPLIIEIILLTLLVIWIFLVVTKPRYNKSATLYVGEIRYNAGSMTHTVRNFRPVKLDKFNKLKHGNGRLKFKRKADVVSANGIRIRADHGGRIICEMMFPWYRGKLEPADSDFTNLRTPREVSEYISKHKRLEINEFATTEAIEGEFDRGIAPAASRTPKYIVIPDSGSGVSVVDGKKVIKSGKIFIYVN